MRATVTARSGSRPARRSTSPSRSGRSSSSTRSAASWRTARAAAMSDDDTKDMVETVDVSPREAEIPEAPGADVFRQLLHQAVRVADMANSQAMRMALDFAKVYEREQGVRRYVEAIAERLGLPEELVEEFGYSSVMHDVGKIHTPDHILQSEHVLSDDEFSVIKQHCIDGEKMLGTARFFETARAIAREHHERWDGKGYPDGKKGE